MMRTMSKAFWAAVALVGLVVSLAWFSASSTASTRPLAATTTPGNNGTIKIHDGAGEPDPITQNNPIVCTFHMHAFNFDSGQTLTWVITEIPPTGSGQTVLTGSYTMDSEGTGRDPATGAFSLPNGHYKLTTDTGNGVPTRDKHKVFWVRCAPPTTPPPTTPPPTTPPPTNPPPTNPPPTLATSIGPQTGAGGTASRGFPVVPTTLALLGLALAATAWVVRRRAVR